MRKSNVPTFANKLQKTQKLRNRDSLLTLIRYIFVRHCYYYRYSNELRACSILMFYIKYTLTNLKATLLGSEVAQYGIASIILSSVLPPEPLLLLPPSLAASSSSFRTLSLFFLEKNNIKNYNFSICEKYFCFFLQAFVQLRVHYFNH